MMLPEPPPPVRLLNRDIGTLLLALSCDASREKAPAPAALDLERLRLRPRLSSIECVGSRGVRGPWSTERLVGLEKLWWRVWCWVVVGVLGRLSFLEWLVMVLGYIGVLGEYGLLRPLLSCQDPSSIFGGVGSLLRAMPIWLRRGNRGSSSAKSSGSSGMVDSSAAGSGLRIDRLESWCERERGEFT